MLTPIIEMDGKHYGSLSIESLSEFAYPFPAPQYPCLIWDHGSDFSIDEIYDFTHVLIKTGCRYLVCGGERCELWHDLMDEAIVMTEVDSGKDLDLIMTTWHTNKSPEEVADFFIRCAKLDDCEFTHYLVLHMGTGDGHNVVNEAVRKEVIAKHEDKEDFL